MHPSIPLLMAITLGHIRRRRGLPQSPNSTTDNSVGAFAWMEGAFSPFLIAEISRNDIPWLWSSPWSLDLCLKDCSIIGSVLYGIQAATAGNTTPETTPVLAHNCSCWLAFSPLDSRLSLETRGLSILVIRVLQRLVPRPVCKVADKVVFIHFYHSARCVCLQQIAATN